MVGTLEVSERTKRLHELEIEIRKEIHFEEGDIEEEIEVEPSKECPVETGDFSPTTRRKSILSKYLGLWYAYKPNLKLFLGKEEVDEGESCTLPSVTDSRGSEYHQIAIHYWLSFFFFFFRLELRQTVWWYLFFKEITLMSKSLQRHWVYWVVL